MVGVRCSSLLQCRVGFLHLTPAGSCHPSEALLWGSYCHGPGVEGRERSALCHGLSAVPAGCPGRPGRVLGSRTGCPEACCPARAASCGGRERGWGRPRPCLRPLRAAGAAAGPEAERVPRLAPGQPPAARRGLSHGPRGRAPRGSEAPGSERFNNKSINQ